MKLTPVIVGILVPQFGVRVRLIEFDEMAGEKRYLNPACDDLKVSFRR